MKLALNFLLICTSLVSTGAFAEANNKLGLSTGEIRAFIVERTLGDIVEVEEDFGFTLRRESGSPWFILLQDSYFGMSVAWGIDEVLDNTQFYYSILREADNYAFVKVHLTEDTLLKFSYEAQPKHMTKEDLGYAMDELALFEAKAVAIASSFSSQ